MEDRGELAEVPEPVRIVAALLGKLLDWPAADHIPLEDILAPEVLAQWNEESKARARRVVENTSLSNYVDHISPRWAKVPLVVDAPSEGYTVTAEEGEVLAAVPIYLRFYDDLGWRVGRIGGGIAPEDLPD